jgi:hypothetical protein
MMVSDVIFRYGVSASAQHRVHPTGGRRGA